MSWAEIGSTSLPQARMLLTELHHVDGHVAVSETLVAIAKALTGDNSPTPSQSSSPAPISQEMPDAGVMIPELESVLKRMASESHDDSQSSL